MAKESIKLLTKVSTEFVLNQVIFQDALKALDCIPDKSVDLIVADPPYNLTKSFGSKVFKEMDMEEYKSWLDKWLKNYPESLKMIQFIFALTGKHR